MNITLEGVTKTNIPETAKDSNIAYLKNLLGWIDTNCTVTISEDKLDFTRKLDTGKDDTIMDIFIENVSFLKSEEKRILITDDSIYSKFFPVRSGKVLSSELFMKLKFQNNEDIQNEFLRNRFIGITISSDQLINEFNRKLKSQPNNFVNCLNNTSLRIIPNNDTITTVVRFLKKIAADPVVSPDLFIQESTAVLINLPYYMTKI